MASTSWKERVLRARGAERSVGGIIFGLARDVKQLPQFLSSLLALYWLACSGNLQDRPRRIVRARLRRSVRALAFRELPISPGDRASKLLAEVAVLLRWGWLVRPLFERTRTRSVVFVGQCYYHHWYLSRELRRKGWRTRLVDWDLNPHSRAFYHGADRQFEGQGAAADLGILEEFVRSLYQFDVAHFANAEGLQFASATSRFVSRFGFGVDILLMRRLGIRIVHSNNACRDGVRQSTFARWGPYSPCSICRWRQVPSVCSDEKNLIWGSFRNRHVDAHLLLGGNHVEFNNDFRVIESPETYCLDPDIWHPELDVPLRHRLPTSPPGTVRLYHAVGNMRARTDDSGVNIKCTHIYLPLIERLRQRGLPVELVSPPTISNLEIRFVQRQSDILLEMLTYGWVGAVSREFMMLGKPVVGFIRPEWLASIREHCPEFADELPVIQATPETVEEVLVRLIEDADLRRTVGERSRAFALKWHSSEAGARFASQVYEALLAGQPLPRAPKHRRRVLHV